MVEWSLIQLMLLRLVFRAKGGELQSVLDRDEIPEEQDVIRVLRQVLSGLAFLHQYDIAHLDLKVQILHFKLFIWMNAMEIFFSFTN